LRARGSYESARWVRKRGRQGEAERDRARKPLSALWKRWFVEKVLVWKGFWSESGLVGWETHERARGRRSRAMSCERVMMPEITVGILG
jgi:hypothetical protein